LKKIQSIVIAGGGTGGHLFPGLAVAHYFHKKDPLCTIRFVGTKKGIEQKIIKKTPYSLHLIPIAGLYRKNIFQKIYTLALIPFSVLRSLFFLLSWKPDFVLGVGGYAAGPFLIACMLLRQKFFIQEQNAYPGMTNKFFGKYADLSFLVQKDEYGIFKNPVVVGNPIRPEIHALWKNNFSRKNEKFQITILGGSGGSQIVNKIVLESLPKLKKFQKQLKILHQSGVLDYQKLKDYYQDSGYQHKVEVFFDDMTDIFQNTHLFIGRAGAGVFEMVAAGRIGILIPIANSSGDHQKKNALQLAKNAGCFLLEEKEASGEKLADMILKILQNKKNLKQREELATKYYQGDASEKIYQQINHFFKNNL
jgi:UDP-N-acetylglucosamine--N-acetylmuramyl-(pentapeptide) pyrophosphoryl-undecaprenol N-acetylglucosamine transferase